MLQRLLLLIRWSIHLRLISIMWRRLNVFNSRREMDKRLLRKWLSFIFLCCFQSCTVLSLRSCVSWEGFFRVLRLILRSVCVQAFLQFNHVDFLPCRWLQRILPLLQPFIGFTRSCRRSLVRSVITCALVQTIIEVVVLVSRGTNREARLLFFR